MSSDRSGLSRREALKAAAATAAAACTPKGGADSGLAPGAGDTGPGRIDHVIVVMMENRSFDHWLGSRSLEEGRTEENGLTAEMSNPTADGTPIAPFPSDDPCLHDPPHSWSRSRRQFNEGENDGFVRQYSESSGGDGSGIMAYQRRSDLPLTYALADAFTVCDNYHCSVMGGTWPNRLYAQLATCQGVTGNHFPTGALSFDAPSIWQALDDKGVEWNYFYSDVPFIGLLSDHWREEQIGFVEEFFRRVDSGTLAPVTWIDPAFSFNDNHPPHHPAMGELFLGAIYEALAASSFWERCLIIITFDEHGGFFDHAPPPRVPDERAEDDFDQLGFRVPTVLVGPWVKAGVDHTLYEHTSWMKMLCETYDIEPWNQRLEHAPSLASALDTDRMERNDPLPAVSLPAFDADPDELPQECITYAGAPPPHLMRIAEVLRARGCEVRLEDRRAVSDPILNEWRKRGLIE
jgi:phospholipase C